VASLDDMDFLVASGSLPLGIPTDFYARLARIAAKKKAKFVLDTSGEALRAAIHEGVYLFKPNLGEMSALLGIPEIPLHAVAEHAQILHRQIGCEAMVVSMGPDGALLVTAGGTERIPSPKVEKKSTVGAGDSMVAGMVYALAHGKTMSHAARYGVACGTAATINPGTALCNKADADRLFAWIAEEING